MRQKYKKRTIVHYVDQIRRKNKECKMLSLMTYCQCCKKQITKKNKVDKYYFCDSCHNLNSSNLYLKYKSLQYIDWDSDLDYLYYHFWLDDTKV